MLDVFNTFNQTKADIQLFYQDAVWTKPRGASFIYMMLIGGGGSGGMNGGGSGAVTRWMGSAINVPDNLVIHPSTGNADNTTVSYKGTTLTTLLTANAATTSTGGTASTANTFSASGFFASTAGQNGVGAGGTSASSTTFLSGGGTSGGNTANYGYISGSLGPSFFMLQPIIVGCGANGTTQKNTAIGCGASANASSLGGRGLVIIASW